MRLIQFEDERGARQVGVVEGERVAVLEQVGSTRELALAAIGAGRSLQEHVAQLAKTPGPVYQQLLQAKRVLSPLDHPDPAHCLISGTGLTHLGSAATRDAMHQTDKPAEAELTDSMRIFHWGIEGGHQLRVFQTAKAKVGILLCYDSEFPEAARYLADQGIEILFVPYCTDDRQGYCRVRYCCQARAIENQIYVVTAGIVGNLPSVPAMDIHYGRAAVYSPADFEFARDGIQAEADSNVEMLLVSDLDINDLYRSRSAGSVRPRLDRRSDLFEYRAKFEPLPEISEHAEPFDPVDDAEVPARVFES